MPVRRSGCPFQRPSIQRLSRVLQADFRTRCAAVGYEGQSRFGRRVLYRDHRRVPFRGPFFAHVQVEVQLEALVYGQKQGSNVKEFSPSGVQFCRIRRSMLYFLAPTSINFTGQSGHTAPSVSDTELCSTKPILGLRFFGLLLRN